MKPLFWEYKFIDINKEYQCKNYEKEKKEGKDDKKRREWKLKFNVWSLNLKYLYFRNKI